MEATMKLADPADPEVRKSGIGGSDSAAILGENPYRSALDTYMNKLGLGDQDDTSSEAAEWGNILEPVILQEYAKRTGQYVLGRSARGEAVMFCPDGREPQHEPGAEEVLNTIRDPQRPWRMAHLDGVVVDPKSIMSLTPLRILEAKTASAFLSHKWGDADTDEAPLEYLIQGHHNAGVYRSVSGLNLPVDIPVLIGGQKLRIYTIEADPELDAMILEREGTFWNDHVLKQCPPPATPDELGKKALARFYPEDNGDEILVGYDDDLYERALDLKAHIAILKEQERTFTGRQNKVKELMGEASKLVGPDFSITWKNQKGRTNWKHVAEMLGPHVEPEVYIEAVDNSQGKSSRVFRATFKDTEE